MRQTGEVTLSEADRTKLWTRANSRCSICKRTLVAGIVPARPGEIVGRGVPIVDVRIRAAEDLVLLPGYLDSYENYILLCVDDASLVQERRTDFSTADLMQLKAIHEAEQAPRAASSTQVDAVVRLLVHMAGFVPQSPPYYFLKISNHTQSTVRLDRVWFDTSPEVAVENDQRPLPTLLSRVSCSRHGFWPSRYRRRPRILGTWRARCSETDRWSRHNRT